jgi:peptidoglycan/LPS O-acetylase OafA/YrhL
MKANNKLQIYGLQAVAIGAIILYHAQITIYDQQLFKGGFIGVDIFFVISGYLITSIILKELITTDSFSFKNFYERRIRQIFPVLLLVILASLPFAWLYLLPADLLNFSKSIITLLSFSSNFYFHYSGNAFGELGSLSKPLLHTWLISVLAQYYILFPIILLIVFRYFKKYIIHILILGFVISLGLADWFSRNYPSISFYFFQTRFWELLAGSILAYFEITLGHRSKKKSLNLILPFIGLILIGHSILFFNDEIFHPSFYTLSPIIGVCLIIWYSDKDGIITKILSTKLLVGIGLISYSLYLWHYPIFAFARITEFGHSSILKKSNYILLLFLLSIISYYFIEKPLRIRNREFNKFLIKILFTVSLIGFCSLVVFFKNGFENRVDQVGNNFNQMPHDLLRDSDGKRCFSKIDGCVFNTGKKNKIFLIGDSLSGGLSYFFKTELVKKNFEVNIYSMDGCHFFLGFNKIDIKTQNKMACNFDYMSNIKNKLDNEKDSIIVFVSFLTKYLTNERIIKSREDLITEKMETKFINITDNKKNVGDSFVEVVNKLKQKHKIILVYPIHEAGFKLQKKHYDQENNYYNLTNYSFYENRNKITYNLLDNIKGNNILRVYPHKIFCNSIIIDKCVVNKNNIFYFYNDHPSIVGSQMINDLIIKEIEKIELKSN